MALDELLAALERDGRAKAGAMLDAARAEAGRIVAGSEERMACRRSAALEVLDAELRVETAKLVGAAREAARRDVLSARQRMLDRVFRAAERRLADVGRSEAYLARLGDDLAEARSYLGEIPAVVRCTPCLSAHVRAWIEGKEGLSIEEDLEGDPGIVLLAADGSVEVESTLRLRLDRSRPLLSMEVLVRIGVQP